MTMPLPSVPISPLRQPQIDDMNMWMKLAGGEQGGSDPDKEHQSAWRQALNRSVSSASGS